MLVADQAIDPTLAAILPLIGVVLGAALAGGVRWYLDRRAEKRNVRAAFWLLIDDLDRIASIVDPAGGTPGAMGTPQSRLDADADAATWLRSVAWASERRTIARGLADHREVWDQLRWTMLQAEVLAGLATAHEHGPKNMNSITTWIATEDEFRMRVIALRNALQPMAGRTK